MSFWDNVQFLVTQQKTTYRWLAEKIDVSETTLSGWRRTDVEPRAHHSVMIAEALNTTVEFLATFERNKEMVGESTPRYGTTNNFHPRLRGIIADLSLLSDSQLEDVSIQVHALAQAAIISQAGKTAG